MKPILLLDVDGVLCVPGKDCQARVVKLEYAPGKCIPFWPNLHTERFLRMAWALFDVRWLTAWGSGANAIARNYGLEERPTCPDQGGEEWKARGAIRELAGDTRPVAWIEDGITPFAKALARRRGWVYVHCEPFVGAQPWHIEVLEDFARRARAARPSSSSRAMKTLRKRIHAGNLSRRRA